MPDGWLAPQYIGWLLQGAGLTALVSLVTALTALTLGFPLCLARLSPRRWLAWPALAWLSLLRNTPLLVQLFFWYFGAAMLLPPAARLWLNTPHMLLPGLPWPSFELLAGWVGLSLYSAAFIAEEFRAGIRGVGAGQVAAAQALGLRHAQVWRHVVLPQALHIARTPLRGQLMTIVKNSSLLMAIGVAELSYRARQADAQSFQSFQVYALATLLYLLLIGAMELAGHWRQRHAQVR